MCKRKDCKKKAHESEILILCPACLEVKHQTLSHVKPQCLFGDTYPYQYLCWDCHSRLEKLLPKDVVLHEDDYLQIAREFLLDSLGGLLYV